MAGRILLPADAMITAAQARSRQENARRWFACPRPKSIAALQQALADTRRELRVVRTERDLLKEQLNQFKRLGTPP